MGGNSGCQRICFVPLPNLSYGNHDDLPPTLPSKGGDNIDEFLSGEVQRLAINGGVQLTTPSDVSQFSQSMVAKDLYGIPSQERELAMHEVHGVIDQIEETPQLISDCLSRMEEHVQTLLHWLKSTSGQVYIDKYRNPPTNINDPSTPPPTTTPSSHPYERALSMNREYVQSDPFRISFLRADRFDPVKAAERLLRYFEEKEYLFGAELMGRPILLRDLDPDTISRLESGYLQILPARDVAGRPVFLSIGRLQRTDIKTDAEVRNEVRTTCDTSCDSLYQNPESMIKFKCGVPLL
jgi:hypothetical protein